MSDNTIVFLYINGLHQLYHSAMTAMELSRLQKDFKVKLVSCHASHTQVLEQIKTSYPGAANEIITLRTPFRFKYLNYKKKSFPAIGSSIRLAAPLLREAAAIVCTSEDGKRNCLRIGATRPKVIYQAHGCGDRQMNGEYGFGPAIRDFDLLLISGSHHQEKLITERGIDPRRIAAIGYPKLDYSVDVIQLRRELFGNDRPIILYSPHHSPSDTSLKLWGREVARFFARSTDYNLIFAPHVLCKHLRAHHRYDLDFSEFEAPHIRFDFGSLSSVNGSYLKVADIYLGDVSSMVYEWVALRPRPCVFLNAHGVEWKGKVDYRFWDMGPVVDTVDRLGDALRLSVREQSFLDIQRRRIEEYIDIKEKPASLRAAEAIYEFLRTGVTQPAKRTETTRLVWQVNG